MKRQVQDAGGDYIIATQTAFRCDAKIPTRQNWLEARGAAIIVSFRCRCEPMRASLTVPLLLVSLLSACTTTVVQPASQISQSGSLKVHPGLLGQPVPPELQTPTSQVVKPVESEIPQPPANTEDLRTQRSLYFSLNQTDLKADYDQVLMAHARYLARTPAARMRIEGHADERGSANYNKQLGLKRAQSIRATLIGNGADPAQIGLKSWGNSRPKVRGRDEAAWAENRRADIVYERER